MRQTREDSHGPDRVDSTSSVASPRPSLTSPFPETEHAAHYCTRHIWTSESKAAESDGTETDVL